MQARAQNDKEAIRAIRESAAVSSWPLDRTAEAIRLRCRVSRLRAYRLASGWTLTEVATRIRVAETDKGRTMPHLSHSRISRWETGGETPSSRYLDALCRIYHTRADLLGFGIDYSQQPDAQAQESDDYVNRTTPSVAPAVVTKSKQVSPETATRREESECGLVTQTENSDSTLRFAAAVEAGDYASVFWIADQTRQKIVDALQKRSIYDVSVDWWEAQARHYGSNYRVAPPVQLLSDILIDLDIIQQVLAHRQPAKSQRRLSQVVAQLAGLVGIIYVDLHRPKDASRWFQAGQVAAIEAENSSLRAWLATRAALSCLYHGSAEEAITLAQSARRLAGPLLSTATAMAPAVEARALAQLGRGQEALTLLRYAGKAFHQLSNEVQSAGVFGFSEQKFRFYEGNVLARTDEWCAARASQERALKLYGLGDPVDRGHILLDQATCLLRQGELEEASRSACEVLVNLTPDGGIGALLTHATELYMMAARRDPRQGIVKALQEVILIRKKSLSLQRNIPPMIP